MFHKTRHKLLSAFLAVCMVLSLIPMGAWAEEDTPVTYSGTYSSGGHTITISVTGGTVAEQSSGSNVFTITATGDNYVPASYTITDGTGENATLSEGAITYTRAAGNKSATLVFSNSWNADSNYTITITCSTTNTPDTETAHTITVQIGSSGTAETVTPGSSGYTTAELFTEDDSLTNLSVTITGNSITEGSKAGYYSYSGGKFIGVGEVNGEEASDLSYDATTRKITMTKDFTDAISGITIYATTTPIKFTVTSNVTGATTNIGATGGVSTEVNSGNQYQFTLTTASKLASFAITIGEQTYTANIADNWVVSFDTDSEITVVKADETNGTSTYTVTISKDKVKGNIIVTANVNTPVDVTLPTANVTVTNAAGTGTTASPKATKGTDYTANIVAADATKKPLKTITVTISGTTYTYTAATNTDGKLYDGTTVSTITYNKTTGLLTIPGTLVPTTGGITIGATVNDKVSATFTGSTVSATYKKTSDTTAAGTALTATAAEFETGEGYTVTLTPATSENTIKNVTVTVGTVTYKLLESYADGTNKSAAATAGISYSNGVITFDAKAVTDTIAISADAAKTVTVRVSAATGSNITASSKTIDSGTAASVTLEPTSGYAVSAITVSAYASSTATSATEYKWTMSATSSATNEGSWDKSVTGLSYAEETGVLSIPATLTTNNVTVAVTTAAGVTVTQTLGSSITSSFTQKSIAAGKTFSATFTTTDGTAMPESFTVAITSMTSTSTYTVTTSTGAVSPSGSGITYTASSKTLSIPTSATTTAIAINMSAVPTVTCTLTNYTSVASKALTYKAAASSVPAYYTTGDITLKPSSTSYYPEDGFVVKVGTTDYYVYLPTTRTSNGSCTVKVGTTGSSYTAPKEDSTWNGTPVISAYYYAATSSAAAYVVVSVDQRADSTYTASAVTITSAADPILTLNLTSLQLNGTSSNPSNASAIAASAYAITGYSVSMSLAVKSTYTAPSSVVVTIGTESYTVTLPTSTSGSATVTKNGTAVTNSGITCLKNTGSGSVYTLTISPTGGISSPVTVSDNAVLTITQNLSGMNSSNLATTATLNGSWTTYLTEKPSYELSKLSVQVNGYTFTYNTKTSKFEASSGFSASATIPVTYDESTGKLTVTGITTPVVLTATATGDKSASAQVDVTFSLKTTESLTGDVTYRVNSGSSQKLSPDSNGVYSITKLSLGDTVTISATAKTATSSSTTISATINVDAEWMNVTLYPDQHGGHQIASVISDGSYTFTVEGLDTASQFTYAFGSTDYKDVDSNVQKLEMQVSDVTKTLSTSTQSDIEDEAGKYKTIGSCILIENYVFGKTVSASAFENLGSSYLGTLTALTFTLPTALQGKSGLSVICYENGKTTTLSTTTSSTNTSVDYYTLSEDGKTLTIYTDTESAIYAIVYDAPTYTLSYNVGEGAKAMDPVKVLQNDGKGETVTLTAPTSVNEGYTFKGWYLDADFTQAVEGSSVTVTKDMTVYAKWEAPKAAVTFTDIKESDYYYDAVLWAVENSITVGVGGNLFNPDGNCTRGQVVTFLWRAAGCPEPTTSTMPFEDVPNTASTYYYKAVLWAVEKGITKGTSDTTFSPSATVTRAEFVTFLWRYENEPTSSAINPFEDVEAGQYYYQAVLWAVENEVTTGTSNITFSPKDNCTRCQVVTFLYRDLVKN